MAWMKRLWLEGNSWKPPWYTMILTLRNCWGPPACVGQTDARVLSVGPIQARSSKFRYTLRSSLCWEWRRSRRSYGRSWLIGVGILYDISLGNYRIIVEMVILRTGWASCMRSRRVEGISGHCSRWRQCAFHSVIPWAVRTTLLKLSRIPRKC